MPAVNQKLQLMGISDEEAQAFFDTMEGDRHGGVTIHQFLGESNSLRLFVNHFFPLICMSQLEPTLAGALSAQV